jgi:hypothetical protein
MSSCGRQVRNFINFEQNAIFLEGISARIWIPIPPIENVLVNIKEFA